MRDNRSMASRWLHGLFGIGLLAGLAATPSAESNALDRVREGNAAFERGDLDAADHAYTSARERTDDPGLVAFNAATVRVARGDYRDAELHYLRTLDDRAAPPERRARASYNRGLCILNRGGDASAYRLAILCFEDCLESTAADAALAADARHNLELAKLLWAKARVAQKNPPKANDPPPEEEHRPEQNPQTGGTTDGSETGGNAGANAAKPTPIGGPPPNGQQPQSTAQKAPGAGNLPVLLDAERPQPLNPEDTRALLDRIQTRLANDRRANARLLAGPERANVRDW